MRYFALLLLPLCGLLIAATVSRAAGRNVIYVHSGESVVVNSHLRCFVGTGDIVCGGSLRAHVAADVRGSGEIVIIAEPNIRGAVPVLYVERAKCSASSGSCRLVTRQR